VAGCDLQNAIQPATAYDQKCCSSIPSTFSSSLKLCFLSQIAGYNCSSIVRVKEPRDIDIYIGLNMEKNKIRFR
jgi:hypothetical protein